MRISSQKALDQMRTAEGGMSSQIAQQIERALNEGGEAAVDDKSKGARKTASSGATTKIVKGESEGEASVRLALYSAFGCWQSGGEVVQELIPFESRKFRVDFALPRWKCFVEIDGWQHHGAFLSDHNSDRLRGLYFSSNDWLPFRVSHGQAISNPGLLIDSISSVMKSRQPLPRDSIALDSVHHKHGTWYRLRWTP